MNYKFWEMDLYRSTSHIVWPGLRNTRLLRFRFGCCVIPFSHVPILSDYEEGEVFPHYDRKHEIFFIREFYRMAPESFSHRLLTGRWRRYFHCRGRKADIIPLPLIQLQSFLHRGVSSHSMRVPSSPGPLAFRWPDCRLPDWAISAGSLSCQKVVRTAFVYGLLKKYTKTSSFL